MALTARLLLALALGLSYVECGLNVGGLGGVVPVLAGVLPAAVGLGAVLHVAGLVGWVREPQASGAAATRAGALVLGPLLAAGGVEAVWSPSGIHHGKLLPTVVLAAWMIGAHLGRGTSPGAALQGAHEAACGAVAAIYGLAAGAKVVGSGAAWFEPSYLGTLLVERSVGAPAPLAAARLWLAGHPPLVTALATGALVAEAAGVLFLWPRWRRPVAAVLVALHAGIAVGMGYVYVTWALAVVALAWPLPAGPTVPR